MSNDFDAAVRAPVIVVSPVTFNVEPLYLRPALP
jgi:hypothetical protein